MGQRQGSFLRNRPLLDDGVLVVTVLVVELLMIMFMNHDAGESHHKLWPTFEPGNVFLHLVLGYFLTSWLTAKF